VSPTILPRHRRRARPPGVKRQQRISAILRSFTDPSRTDTTLGDLNTAFGAQAFGAFFILLGGINLVPGASLIATLPLLLVTAQLACGRRRLWLPEKIRRIPVSPDTLRRVMDKIGPSLRRIERYAQPRMWPFHDRIIEPVIGWMAFILAAIIAIPAVFTNMAPGIAVALLGVALTARDGAWLIAGIVVGVGSALFLVVVYGAALMALLHFLL
jgi:hypothetical protein